MLACEPYTLAWDSPYAISSIPTYMFVNGHAYNAYCARTLIYCLPHLKTIIEQCSESVGVEIQHNR